MTTETKRYVPVGPGELRPAELELVFEKAAGIQGQLTLCSLAWGEQFGWWDATAHLRDHPRCERRYRAYRRLRANLTGMSYRDDAP